MTRVLAKKQGFHGHLREPGDVFDIADDEELGEWMVEVDKQGNPVTKKGMTLAEKDQLVKGAPPASAPFVPKDLGFKAKHKSHGNFIVVDANGDQVGRDYLKDEKDNAKAKSDAQAEADRLNAGGELPVTTSPQQAAVLQAEDVEDEGPDA